MIHEPNQSPWQAVKELVKRQQQAAAVRMRSRRQADGRRKRR